MGFVGLLLDLGSFLLLYHGLVVESGCSIIVNQGTKVVYPETSRTYAAIFTKITSKGIIVAFLGYLKGLSCQSSDYLHKDQSCQFLKVEGPNVNFLQTLFPGHLWNT